MTSLTTMQTLITRYEKKYARAANSVQLLAASKGQASEKILSLYQAGQRLFGENYLQEALKKIAVLPNDISWHFIGPIQSNKTRKMAEHFSWVHSVSSLPLAKRLSSQRPLHLPPLQICIEVNLDNEASKSGVAHDDVLSLAIACSALPQLTLRGLMTIPAPTTDFTQQRHTFHQLFLLLQTLRANGLSVDTLSMGMSADLEAAIAAGATIVRIGRALFGDR